MPRQIFASIHFWRGLAGFSLIALCLGGTAASAATLAEIDTAHHHYDGNWWRFAPDAERLSYLEGIDVYIIKHLGDYIYSDETVTSEEKEKMERERQDYLERYINLTYYNPKNTNKKFLDLYLIFNLTHKQHLGQSDLWGHLSSMGRWLDLGGTYRTGFIEGYTQCSARFRPGMKWSRDFSGYNKALLARAKSMTPSQRSLFASISDEIDALADPAATNPKAPH